MDIGALISSGCLDEAIAALGDTLRANPTNYRRRTSLFALLCYAGNYQRAEQQLAVLAQEGVEMQLGADSWRTALLAAQKRERVFTDGLTPTLALGVAAPDCFGPYVDVIRAIAVGDVAAAQTAAARGAELSADYPGQLHVQADGDAATATPPGHITAADIRDADDRLGPFLELFLGSDYAWLPFSAVHSMDIRPPRHLLDLLYAPLTLETAMGRLSAVMPVLYPGTATHPDAQVRLGRMTVWQESPDLAIGAGARLLATPADDIPLLQVRHLRAVARENA